jgi:hypothetical protein
MNVTSRCVWCKSRYSTTVPELCDDLRLAIEDGDEHNALIMAFATELALFQELWPYCSRRCENEDVDYPVEHPDREGLEIALRGIESLPWAHIRAKAQGLEAPPPRPDPPKLVAAGPNDPPPTEQPPEAPVSDVSAAALRLVESLEEAEEEAQEWVDHRRKQAQASFRKAQGPRLGLWTFGTFTVGFFAGSLLMHLMGLSLGDTLMSVSGSTLLIGGLLGVIAALLATRKPR